MTHVLDATTFFAQICNVDTAAAYQTMITQLFEHCSFALPLATEIQPNQVKTKTGRPFSSFKPFKGSQ